MSFNIDSAIFIGFLVVNLVFGLWSSRDIKNIKEYAIGDRNFSTATIAATIVATWANGNSIGSVGDFFLIPGLPDVICLLLIGYVLAPRMGEFLGSLSVADAMGNLYGREVRIISAVSGIMASIGNVALQFVILSALLSYALDIPSFYALLISSFIVIAYSTFGGIKAVTFTDMIQFFTFGVVVPMTAFVIWKAIGDVETMSHVLATNPIYDYSKLHYSDPNFSKIMLVFFFFALPGLDPAIFQRISMAKNTTQVSKSFCIAAIGMLGLFIMFCLIGILVLTSNNDPKMLEPTNLIRYILDNYMDSGFKGMFVIGITAVIMSTADSYINCSAVLFAHDFCKSLKVNLTDKRELLLARFSAFLIGISALLISLFSTRILDLILATYSFYMPIVSVPLLLAIFGFRSTSKSVLIGMSAGFITVISFKLLSDIDSLIPGILANLVFFISSHYLLKQAGGLVGIKDNRPLMILRAERVRKINTAVQRFKAFDFLEFCKSNLPKEEKLLVYFGLFCIVSVFSNAYSLPIDIHNQYATIIEGIYYSVLITSTIFITYPFWLKKFKNETFISVLWNIIVFFNLAFSSSLFVLFSRFSSIQIVILMANLITVAVLMRWQTAMFIIISGVVISTGLYKSYIDEDYLPRDMDNLQFKIVYLLLLVSSILIAFLKPKQQHQELTEEQNAHLNGQIVAKTKEVQEALALRGEFIRNMNHEYHAPMMGVISMSEGLQEAYDKLNDIQRKRAIDVIVKSAHSLKSLEDNLTTLTELSKPHYELDKEDIDFSDLLYNRIQKCRKLYEENKEDREFILDIEEKIIINADKNYMIQLIDNLIINSISYCKKGKIRVTLSQNEENISFVIADEGVGIPKNELYEIFEPFTVSSRTKTPAGGRGVGLAICKRILEVHGGTINAESKGEKGATFRVVLPKTK